MEEARARGVLLIFNGTDKVHLIDKKTGKTTYVDPSFVEHVRSHEKTLVRHFKAKHRAELEEKRLAAAADYRAKHGRPMPIRKRKVKVAASQQTR
jgi:hypothetical protein